MPGAPRPRIGFDAALVSSEPGYRSAGIHRYSLSLLAALAAIGEVEVHAFVADPAAAGLLPPGVAARPAPAMASRAWGRILWEQVGLPVDLRRGSYDLVHGAAYAVPLLAPCPSVATIHDLSPFRLPGTMPATRGLYLRAAIRLAARRAGALIAVSAFTARELVACVRVDPDRVHVVPSGIEPRFAAAGPDEALAVRRALDLPPAYLLAVGTLEPRKNLRTLLEAYGRLAATRRDVPDLLVAGGRGWGSVDPVELAARLGAAGRVRVMGFVDEELLPGLYAGATAFAFPSLYEGFGLPPLEAMAAGAPTIVADAGSLPEVTGGAAEVVPPLDVEAWAAALERLLDDSRRRSAMSAAGRARAAELTWPAAARGTLDAYAAAMAAGGRSRSRSASGVGSPWGSRWGSSPESPSELRGSRRDGATRREATHGPA